MGHRSNMAYPDASQITGTHLEDGEDVEVIGLSNIRQPGGENKLFRFVSTLVQKVLKKHPDIIYRLSDAAVLVDTEDAEKDVDIFISIFTSEEMNVARASDTSTDALTIDTLDHFKELEAKVCIIVLAEDAWEEKSLSDRNMLNPRYRAYTASHATVLVVYITERHHHPTVISGMGFDVIPAPKPSTSTSCDSNIQAGEQIAKLVWHSLGTDWITDLAFLHDNDHGHVIFYITKGGHCGFVTMSGIEEKYHQIAYSLNHNAIKPHRVSSSPSRRKMVMTYQEGGQCGNWWWSAYELNRDCNSWKYSGPYPLDDTPISTALSEKGVTTFLLQKSASREYYLRIYRSASSIEEANIKLTSPSHIAVRSDEELFITDQQNIWVFQWQTRQLSLFCRSLNNPYALCVDDSGHVYASHGRIFQEKISMFHFINKEPHRHIITHDASDIRAISVAPGYLAIGTTTGLQLCHSVQ